MTIKTTSIKDTMTGGFIHRAQAEEAGHTFTAESKISVENAERAVREQLSHIDMVRNADRMGAAAVGREYGIRTSDKKTVRGEIVECGFGRFRHTRCTVQAIFRIVIKSGSKNHEFFCRKVPA